MKISSSHNASLARRLGAMLYDAILSFAILIIGTAVLLLTTAGQAIAVGNRFYQSFLFILVSSFFIWFWIHGGQTAGMAAWKLRIVSKEGQPISYEQAILRLLFAITSLLLGGLGLLWLIWDREKLSLYDRLSGTRMIVLKKGTFD
jgi:uncharacterized RDD family membrane protein YckC